jgi:hypothetical protein
MLPLGIFQLMLISLKLTVYLFVGEQVRAAVRAGVPDYQRQEMRDRVRGQVRDQVRAGLPHGVRQQGRFHHQTLWKSYTL